MTYQTARQILDGCRAVRGVRFWGYVPAAADELECAAIRSKVEADAVAAMIGFSGWKQVHYHDNGETIIWDQGKEFGGPYIFIRLRWIKTRRGNKWALYIAPQVDLMNGMDRLTIRGLNKIIKKDAWSQGVRGLFTEPDKTLAEYTAGLVEGMENEDK